MKRFFTSFAWFAFALPFALYFYSLPPGVSLWDTAEMQVVPWIFGIAHPTGFPAYVLLAGIFAHLEPFGNPAWRISLFSAFTMSGAAATLALFLREFFLPRWAAVFGAWIFALGDTAWSRGSRAEVQSLAVLFIGLTLLFAVRWLRTKNPRDAYLAAAAWGFGLATHPVTIFLGAGLFIISILGWKALTVRRAAAILGSFFAPLLLYAYLPLRSAYLYSIRRDPTLELGLPPGLPFWDTNHAAAGLASYLAVAPGQVNGGILGIFDYTKWPVVGPQYGQSITHEFGWFFILFGCIGLLYAIRERPYLWIGMILSVSMTIPFILNFPEADTDRYFLGSFWLFSAACAIGIYHGARGWSRVPPVGSLAAAIAFVVFTYSLGTANANRLDGRNDTSGPDWVARVKAETPENAVIVAQWSYATPLGYAAYDTDDFGHRVPISGWELQYASYYKDWLKTRPLYIEVINPPLNLPPDLGLTATAIDDHKDIYRIELAKRVSLAK